MEKVQRGGEADDGEGAADHAARVFFCHQFVWPWPAFTDVQVQVIKIWDHGQVDFCVVYYG